MSAWGGVEEGGGAADELGRGADGLFIAGAGHPSRAPPSASGRGFAVLSSHGEAWEGDEGEVDERQRVTETSSARRRTEEEDTGEEGDDAQERTVSVVGTARRRRKLRGP